MREQVLIRGSEWVSGGWWTFERVYDDRDAYHDFIVISRTKEKRLIAKTFVMGWRLA